LSVRVAYDVSFLARFFDRPDEQSGVYRSVEEMLYALALRDDLSLTAVGVCGDEPLADSVRSRLYVESRAGRLASCDFRHTFRGRLGLERLYASAFAADASGELERLPRRAPRALWLRGLRSLLYRLAYTYRVDELRHALDPGRFDVFHSPFPPLPPRVLTGGAARVLTIYDLIFVNRPEFMPAEIISFMQRVLHSIDAGRDWVACISEFTKEEFCEHTGMAPERVFVTPLAAAPHFRPVREAAALDAARRRYGIPEGDYFLGVGVLQPRKNLAHLIRCFFRLLAEQNLPDTHLVLAGAQGWMQDEIFAAADASSRERSRVIFAGHVADEDLAAVYGGALAFVYPSLYEGFGLPPLEAMACGTPVITSNTTALPEVVGDAGLTVAPTDADALCGEMLRVARDGRLRAELSERGLRRASEFSWARCAAETVKAYGAAALGRGV
jgi:glycosyltransferase involved in cell wall biosynthesis